MDTEGGEALVLRTEGGKEVSITGMAYADDALWLAPNRQAMQQRVATSGLFYKFMGMENEPRKDKYVEMTVDRSAMADDPTWTPMAASPGTVTAVEGQAENGEARAPVEIERVEPAEAWRYLGKTEGTTWGSDVQQLEMLRNTVLDVTRILRYKRVSAEGAKLVINTVLGPRICYPLRYMAVDVATIDEIQKPILRYWKAVAGICEKSPLQLFDHNSGINRWAESVVADQVTQWTRAINDPSAGVSDLMELGVDIRRHWVGTAGDPMAGQWSADALGDKTWLGKLLENMHGLDMHITGGRGLPAPTPGDENIVDSYVGEHRSMVMQGCRLHDIWWRSQAEAYLNGDRQSTEHGNKLNKSDTQANSHWLKTSKYFHTCQSIQFASPKRGQANS